MATLSKIITNKIIYKLLTGQDYRSQIVSLIDADFLECATEFLKQVMGAKLKNIKTTEGWYKKEMLNEELDKKSIAMNSGLNMKTITNMYNSGTKRIVLNASKEHYENLSKSVNQLTKMKDMNISLKLSEKKDEIEFDDDESLVIINALAVKRSAIRGGSWSTAGKQVEKPLVETMCKLLNVPSEYYDQTNIPPYLREVDYYLLGENLEYHRCEVKMMGMGNPESADGALARESSIFFADKLSILNKKQLDQKRILWVEFRGQNSIEQFEKVLKKIGIPFTHFSGNLKKELKKLLELKDI